MGAIKFKRGTTADKPTLQAGEIYVDTDKKVLTVSLDGSEEIQAGDWTLEYIAWLTQTGETAPTATVFKDNIGITWQRQMPGEYLAYFPEDKYGTFIAINKVDLTPPNTIEINQPDSTQIYIHTTDGQDSTDGLLTNYFIYIKLFPGIGI
jgi:hypothetical protein